MKLFKVKALLLFAFVLLLFFIPIKSIKAQDADSLLIDKLTKETFISDVMYQNLWYLCKNIGGRIAGSPQAALAVEWSKKVMETMGMDTVYKQPIMVHKWSAGDYKEQAWYYTPTQGKIDVAVCALGESIGTDWKGIKAEIIEVKSFKELAAIGKGTIQGKIIFFNRPMDPSFLNTFEAYGGAADQRVHGAAEAAKYGAVGVIVRSLTLSNDKFPHTGVMHYDSAYPKIPAIAISTKDADILSEENKKNPLLQFFFRTMCESALDVRSHNVIGEIKGSVYPDQIITIGGHIDSWWLGEGAHDDGAGCVQTIEIARLFIKLGIKPKRTLRFVMFMDEEIAQRGGAAYVKMAQDKKEKHYAALESDEGGLLPKGFTFDTTEEKVNVWLPYIKYFKPMGIYEFSKGYSGVDIKHLKDLNATCIGLSTNSQAYFNYHHSGNDTFENVNKRELQMGAAAMAALIYLMDKYDL